MALFEDVDLRFLFLGYNKSSKRCAILLLGHVAGGVQNKDSNFESYSNFLANFAVVLLLCKAFQISLFLKILEKISIFSGSHL